MVEDRIPMLRKYLNDQLQRWYPDVGNHVQCNMISVKKFRWSIHFIFHIHGGNGTFSRYILAKVPNKDYLKRRQQNMYVRPKDAIRQEYKALCLLYQNFRNMSDVTAVRPLGYVGGIDALVMEYMPGENMLTMIHKSVLLPCFLNGSILREFSYRSGVLLARLHALERKYPDKKDNIKARVTEDVMGKVEKLYESCKSRDMAELIEKVADNVICLVNSLSDKAVISLLHGDYYPENIVRLKDGRVFTVDTTLHLEGPPEDDIAKFLVGINTMKLRLIFGQRLIPTSFIQGIISAFMHGYTSIMCVNDILLKCYVAFHLLQRWLEVREAMEMLLPRKVADFLHATRIVPYMRYQLRTWLTIMQEES